MSGSSSSSFAADSDVETEELLDRMLTKLALCDDSKLEPLLSNLLPRTISSLSSQSSSVRNKVLEILSHVNKRVKHQSDIGLPLLDLWKLYTDSNVSSMVKNFSIIYVEMAFERAHAKEKESVAPLMLTNISKHPKQHQEIIMRIVMKVVGECHASRIDDDVAAKYRVLKGSEEKDYFLEFFLWTLLYNPSPQSGVSSPGLSQLQVNHLVGKHPLKGEMLSKRKLGILNVIGAMDFEPELIYPHCIVASVDSQEAVAKRGEELLKKKASAASLDNPKLINKLFLLFNGTVTTENVNPEHRVSPGNVTLRMKLMTIFVRSIQAANCFPSSLQCIFGCIYGSGTTSRLKQLGMEFTVWVFKHAQAEQLRLMGPVILNGILKLLDSYLSSEADVLARQTKAFCFHAIGLLAQRVPHLFREKSDMAVRLFEALKMESQSLRSTIQESTNLLASSYMEAPPSVLRDLEALLMENFEAEQGEARFCALRWATSLFDSQHCPSRFICMLGASDSRLDIREMALEGLSLHSEDDCKIHSNRDAKYPRFGDMLSYILKQEPNLLYVSELRQQKLLFPSQTYVVMIRFLLKCLLLELEHNSCLAESPEFRSSIENVCFVLEHAMALEGSVELHATAAKTLVAIGSYLQEMIAVHFAHKISWLRQLLSHINLDTRESVARLLGLASSALPETEACGLLCDLVSVISDAKKLRMEAQHGAICAIGYVTADCLNRTAAIPEDVFNNTVKCLMDIINTESAPLASVAMQALGHIGLRVALPLIAINSSPGAEVLGALHAKLSRLISVEDIKSIQRVVISLGHICVNEKSLSHLKAALDLIFSLSRSKVEDILFAAGEALSFLWGGVSVTADVILRTNYTSLSQNTNFLMGEVSPFSNYRSDTSFQDSDSSRITIRDAITRELFDVLLYSSRKEERCAGTVWLLSLVMYCGHHFTIQQMLPEIQEAFSHLLGDQNELTQELASQGMSIVYELGDPSMKKNLVDALVNTLTGSGKRKRAIKLAEDTEVFQEGAIGESPSGGKLSTYKELCGLANEMGQPDLVYRFMDLANYQASLNSKRGAAFGFSKIAKQAGDALQPHLRLLIPRLIRYQYDPDKNVQDAMAHIWKSLVQDPRKTVDEHLDSIFDDLLVQCGSRLWRSREASCNALADIIQGRKFDQVGKHLKRLWISSFRAMDDIKETVRIAGEKLCRAVTSLTIRLCDVSLTEVSDAKKAMDIALPHLLSEGIMSKVDSIRKASVGIIMKLAKGAGVALRPHLSDLVCCMLESLSSLEDQGLNYVELHAANAGIQTEKLENLRISISKGSPMWETLDLCINVVNTESLDRLVPRLAQLARSSVGLNTRVGVASFITLLVQKVGSDIRPFTGMLLRLLFPIVKDERSPAAKRGFANASAIVLKYTSASQVEKLIEETVALYSGDRNAQISCAILLKSYYSMASDVVSSYQAVAIPAIFISRFEDDNQISSLFEGLWEENTSGESVTLELYLDEIVQLIRSGMSLSSWASKKKSALAICKLSEVLSESLSSRHHILLECLLKEIPGRLWEGKETLLNALGALSKACHKSISECDPAVPSSVLSIVLAACKRKIKKYRESAFSCLEQVINAFGDPQFFQSVFPLLYDMCNISLASKTTQSPLASDAAKKESDDSEEDPPAPVDKLMSCLKACIHVALVDDILGHREKLMHMFLISLSPGFPWPVKVTAMASIREVCSRLQKVWSKGETSQPLHDAKSLVQELFLSVSPRIFECINTVKIGQVHVAASQCLLDLADLYSKTSFTDALVEGFKSDILSLLEKEKNEEAKSLLRKSVDILHNLCGGGT